jgi:hypothetical protein
MKLKKKEKKEKKILHFSQKLEKNVSKKNKRL